MSTNQKEIATWNLGRMEELLPENFKRVSRSIIINENYLYSVERKKQVCTLIKGGEKHELHVPEKQFGVFT